MGKKEFRKGAIAFLAKFFIIYGVLQALILFAPLEGMESGIASVEAGALGLEADGNRILFDSHSFEIAANCTGLMGISVLAAIALSLKKPELKKKIALVVAGSILLLAINLLRLYLVLLAAISFNAEMAEALHTLTWFAMAAAILAIWYFFTKRISGTKVFAEML